MQENQPVNQKKSLLNSFNHAINGFLHSFKMERNMKIHVALAVLVIIAALVTQVTRFEMIALTISIAFVFFAELFIPAENVLTFVSLDLIRKINVTGAVSVKDFISFNSITM
ncbi:MAG: diacylglycerol kinase [Christensenellaceae bacterium]